MPINGTRRERQLDGKEIIELWAQMGSLGRVHTYYQNSGKVNPRSMQPYDNSSLWRAASLYMIESPKEAREIFIAQGDTKTDREWDLFVLRRAMQLYRTHRTTFMRWVVDQEWPREYEYLFKDEFAVKDGDYDYFKNTVRRMPHESTNPNTFPK